MKSYIKKRKHRNGVRPQRKGTLKVRIVTLPTNDQHRDVINRRLMELNKLVISMRFPELDSPKRVWDEYRREGKIRGEKLKKIQLMQRGYDYFNEYRQIETNSLAINAINGMEPIYYEPAKLTNACNTCDLKSNCPFKSIAANIREYVCPIKRTAYCRSILDAIRKPVARLLSTSDMAELALIHLS